MRVGLVEIDYFGPFADAIYRGEDRLPAHLVLKGMYGANEDIQDVLDRVQTAIGVGENELWLGRLLENPDWRTQLTGAVALLFVDDVAPYIEKVWDAVVKGSWMTPQLLAVLSIIDPGFTDHCRARIACHCAVNSPKDLPPPERNRSMGPAPDSMRAGKEAAAIMALCGQSTTVADWVLQAQTDPDLQELIASDRDGGGQIAVEWRRDLREQFQFRGVELSTLYAGPKFRSRGVTFKGGLDSIGDIGQMFCDPQLIIIKDETELSAFNKRVPGIADDWRENISELKNRQQFPIYIVEMDMFTCGIRYGEWRVFYDKDTLQEFIDY
ncbi:hypothetical protein ACFL6N_01075 [Thermodesulfobacteriota bacterium]